MSQTVVCSCCEEEFTAPEGSGGMWLVCPYCGGRTPDPLAFKRHLTRDRPLSGFGVVGAILTVFAGLGTVVAGCGGFCLLPASPIVLSFFGFLAAWIGGIMLLRMERKTRRMESELVGQTLLIAGLIFLAALGSFGFALVTCFSRSF